jgi:hypothetical protein
MVLMNFFAQYGPAWNRTTALSIRSRIKSYHIDTGHDTSAFSSPRLTRLINGIQRVHEKTPRPPRKMVTFDILDSLISHCGTTFDDLSMKAALCVASAAFLRGQDFTYTKWGPLEQLDKPTRSCIQFHEDGNATLTLPYSKTDQLRRGTKIPLCTTDRPSCPVASLKQLFSRYPAPANAPLFGRIDPLAATNHQICFTPAYFTTSLHNLLLRANIDPTGFTKHSLRRGAAQSAADAGLSKTEIQARGRWKSDSVFAYLTPATVAAMKPRTPATVAARKPRTRALHRH